jgi:two-component system, response regulator PdtaR
MERLLSECGWTVTGVALDYASAVRLAAEHPPDLALVDMNLRDGRTGPATAAALHAQGAPCLFVTGDPEQIPADFAGALGVVTKPFSANALVRAVEYLRVWIETGAQQATPPYGLKLAPQPVLPVRRH